MITAQQASQPCASLPSRERGLKSLLRPRGIRGNRVAPFAGAWIEILLLRDVGYIQQVAPFAGAWIEMIDVLDGCA